MVRGIYQNSASMQILNDKLDVVANNLANASTAGFKRKGLFSQQLIGAEQSLERNQIKVKMPFAGVLNYADYNPESSLSFRRFPTSSSSTYSYWGSFKAPLVSEAFRDISTYTEYSPGPIKETGNPLDFAIDGKGFFTINTPEGVGFTRAGQFNLNDNGLLVDKNGNTVEGEFGPIILDSHNFEVSEEGQIIIDNRVVNNMLIVDLNESEVFQIRDGIFFPLSENAIEGNSDSRVRQGYLEDSNVNIVREMVELIKINRHFEANNKAVRTQDDALSKTVNDIAR